MIMKRTITFLVAMVVSVMFISAQTTIFSEGFEVDSTLTNWKTVDVDGDTNNWYVVTQDSAAAHTGHAHVRSRSYLNGSALTPNNWLISSSINLTGVTAPIQLKFWVDSYEESPYFAEFYAVRVSTTNDSVASFTDSLFSETMALGPYAERTIDLSAYAGNTIYIAWQHYNCTDLSRLMLDDISITGNTSITENNQKFDLIVAPNPATDKLYITLTGEVYDVFIYNMVGSKVQEFNGLMNRQSIDVSNLSEGMYVVTVRTEKGNSSRKINIVR